MSSINRHASSLTMSQHHVRAVTPLVDEPIDSDSYSVETGWIPKNLGRRECIRYCPKSGEGQSCECGRRRNEHSRETIDSPGGGVWDMLRDTARFPSNAFGEIEFEDNSDRAKFVRVDYKTPMRAMQVLLTDIWRINRPNLLISVTGGAKRLTLNPRLKQTFKDGLMRAAASTGAMIITAGTSSGVVKVVGQAVHEFTLANGIHNKPVVIGIAPWGLIQDREDLIDEQGSWPATYNPDPHKRRSKEYPLDCDHSHFILVDDGSISRYSSAEAVFRAELESAISKIGTQVAYSRMQVPLVQLVLEGGAGCLDTVASALKLRTSVVVVAGSGRAADILAYAYENTSELEGVDSEGNLISIVAEMEGSVSETIKEMIMKEFLKDEATAEKYLEVVRDCVQNRPYLTVFKRDTGQEIDQAILHALLKVNKHHSIHQLRLALAWNRIDMARTDIFTEGRSWRAEDLEEALFLSLVDNKEEFVRVLLEPSATDIGIDLKKFLTIERLCKIYNTIPKGCLLEQLLLTCAKKRELYTLEDIGLVLRHLMGAWYRPLYLTDLRYRQVRVEREVHEEGGEEIKAKFDALTVPLRGGRLSQHKNKRLNASHKVKSESKMPIVAEITAETVKPLNSEPHCKDTVDGGSGGDGDGRGGFTNPALMDDMNDMPGKKSDDKLTVEDYRRHYRLVRCEKERAHDFDSPFMELFIWAILLHRRELAELCWEEGKLGMAGAVVAERLLASMRANTENSDVTDEIDEILQSFTTKGVGVLSHCHAMDPNKAAFLLIRVMPRFGETTIMHLVAEANVNFTFITHAACQSLVKTIWYGYMAHDTPTLLIVLSVFCPIFLFTINYRATDLKEIMHERKDEERRKDAADIKVTRRSDRKPEVKQVEQANAPLWKRPYHFFTAPYVVFIYTQIFYVAFVLLFALTLMSRFHADRVHIAEYLIYLWIFTIFCEECRQFASVDLNMDVWSLVKRYFSDRWNVVDSCGIGLFVVGLVFRWMDCENCHEHATLFFAIDILIWTLRLLQGFTIARKLGPTLVTIGYMLYDLFWFIWILLIFVVAYGCALHVIMYPNSELEWSLLIDVLKKAYWQIYGELFIEELDSDLGFDCTDDPLLYKNGTAPRCPVTHWYVPIMLGVYILLTNVLMLNLLIAMFSYTFDKIQQETDLHWYFQRYFLVKEFGTRSPLVPPFILLSHIVGFIWMLINMCRRCNMADHEDDYDEGDIRTFKVRLSDMEYDELTMWERIATSEYIRQTQRDAHKEKLRTQREHDAYDKIVSMEKIMGKQMQTMDEQLKRMAASMNWMMQNMGRSNTSEPPPLFDQASISLSKDTSVRPRSGRPAVRRGRSVVEAQHHEQARIHKYPVVTGPKQYRFIVPDSKVPWQVEWPEYAPPYYVAEYVLQKSPKKADPEDLQDLAAPMPFNEMDEERRLDRRSHCGPYLVVDERPLNPMGRTGICGRGNQQRWGPNHAIDPVVTRWCRNSEGNLVKEGGRRVLEFVAVRRMDAARWAIPGGYLTSPDLKATMKKTFMRKALPSCETHPDILQAVEQLFQGGKEVYRGYSDDPRNTDNAWMESIAYNFHDHRGDIVARFPFRAGDRVDMVTWLKITSQITDLYAGHFNILRCVAEMHDAAF